MWSISFIFSYQTLASTSLLSQAYPVHLNLLNLITLSICGKEYKLWSTLFHSFLKPPVSSFFLAIKIYLRTLLLNTLSLCSSLSVRDPDKIIIKCRARSNEITNGLNFKTIRFTFLKHYYMPCFRILDNGHNPEPRKSKLRGNETLLHFLNNEYCNMGKKYHVLPWFCLCVSLHC